MTECGFVLIRESRIRFQALDMCDERKEVTSDRGLIVIEQYVTGAFDYMALYILELRGHIADEGGAVQLLVGGTMEDQQGPACGTLCKESRRVLRTADNESRNRRREINCTSNPSKSCGVRNGIGFSRKGFYKVNPVLQSLLSFKASVALLVTCRPRVRFEAVGITTTGRISPM